MADIRGKRPGGDFFRGINYLPRAALYLKSHPGLLKYVALPFLINVVIFSGAITLGLKVFGHLVDRLPQGDAWYYYLLAGTVWVFFAVVVLILVFFTFTVIGNLIAAPFNGLLSERVEILLTGAVDEEPLTFKGVLIDAGRSLLVESKKMAAFGLAMVLLFLFNLLPAIGSVMFAVGSLLLTLFFLAWEYLSFVQERKQLNFSEQFAYLRKRKLLLLGFATGVLALLAIPFLQLLCIPMAVVAATMLWCEDRAGQRLSV